MARWIPDAPAFILSSSGSTGTPKLIVRSHRSFFHRLRWTWRHHPFVDRDLGCQKAHMTTTHSLYELFEPLLAGAAAVIMSDEQARHLEGFWESIRQRGITRLLIVPSALRASLDMPAFEAPPLRVVVLMGEYVAPELARRAVHAFHPDTSLYSIYGSTEASSALVVDLRESLEPGRELPLGVPISDDVVAAVLDGDRCPVDEGQAGRLYLGGTPLFSGYLNDPDLTGAVLAEVTGHAGLMYDTRDQVRMAEDGRLDFVGRVDHTVKIRGFRVDLPEVERALCEYPGVRQATVVVTGEATGNASLVGFHIPAAVDASSLFAALRAQLPDYMIPSTLVGLDAFPLTSSAKVDRVQLMAEYAARRRDGSGSATLSPLEQQVADAWDMTLGSRGYEPDDSFFEVGGTSLSVFTLVHRLRETFGLDRHQLTEEFVYRFPALRAQALACDSVRRGIVPAGTGENPVLVTLRQGRRGTAREPLFVIASAGGTVGAYQKLAGALTTDRAVLGLRDPFLWGAREATAGFSEWVDVYIAAIRERQPAGPYFICAYSSAGAFGLEIALRLQESGSEVALLALVDPLGLDRMDPGRFGHWAFRAIWMRRPERAMVRLRSLLHRADGGHSGREADRGKTYTPEEYDEVVTAAHTTREHLLMIGALLQLNTGLPILLSEDDFSSLPPAQYLAVLQDRVTAASPDVDPSTLERLAVQYLIQVQSQHSYRLRPYGGRTLLVEPTSAHSGLVRLLLRPYLSDLHACEVPAGPPDPNRPPLHPVLGRLETHFRSMRDDVFVRGLARILDPMLG
jgi:hypothetical protein